jgi:hypothetical protein
MTPAGCRSILFAIVLWLAGGGFAFASANPQESAAQSSQEVLVLLRLPPPHFRGNSDYGGGYGDQLGRSARRRIAVQLAREQGLKLVTDWPMPLIGVDCFVMSVPDARSPSEVAALLSRDKRVAWAEPMNVFHAQGEPAKYNDPLFAAQPAAAAWRLADLHEIATGRNVRVAVIDSMIDIKHPDLAGQVQVSRNFAPGRGDGPEQHGTGVAGVIAARGGNGLGIVGIAPQARLMALRACWQLPAQSARAASTICDTLSLAMALDFAIANKAQVINLSLSGPDAPLLSKLLDAALVRGITVVGAFDNALPGGGFPASHRGVVAATDAPTGVTNGGTYVAPGRGVPTTEPGGRWFLVNGSSYAAAHVSGLFALLRERNSRITRPAILVRTRGGASAIDACATLLQVSGPCACGCSRPLTRAAISPD